MAGAFAVLASLAWWRAELSSTRSTVVLASIGCGWLILGLAAPTVLKPIYHAWMWLAFGLNFVVTRVLLTVLYFVLVLPIAVTARAVGKDPLGRRSRSSYWKRYASQAPVDHFDRLYTLSSLDHYDREQPRLDNRSVSADVTNWSRVVKWAGFAVWICALPVVVLEVGLRVVNGGYFAAPDYLQYDEELGTTLRPGLTQQVGVGPYRVEMRHNSVGLRGREIRTDTPELRVFMLGDSYTYGWGTGNDGTIASQLERMLVEGGKDAEVLNLGVGGYSTAQSALRLRRFAELEPDVVVYVFCDNDPTDNLFFEKGLAHPRMPALYRFGPRVWLRRHSILVRAVTTGRLRQDQWRDLAVGARRRWSRKPAQETEAARVATLRSVRQMRDIADREEARFLITFVNFALTPAGTIELSRTAATYRALFEQEGFETLSPIEALRPYATDWEKLRGDVPFMGHYSAYGYRGYAEALAHAIE